MARPEFECSVGNVALQLRVDGPPFTGEIQIGDVVLVAKIAAIDVGAPFYCHPQTGTRN